MARLTRFAPSPTGPLHLGHAFAALTAAHNADQFLVRIEDIDRPRCRPKYEAQIHDDLHWLGLTYPEPLRQSTRLAAYRQALQSLQDQGLTYTCSCTRADIAAAATAPQGPEGPIYPGTCRGQHGPGNIRLNMAKAMKSLTEIHFTDNGARHHFTAAQMCDTIGDVILARRDLGTSYHLAVTVDDAHQGITHVTRGEDLLPATPIHILLQTLLGLPTPNYEHHHLIRDDQGRRLAKRDNARALSKYRAEGATPQDIRRLINL